MDLGLGGKRALVVGASGGIGVEVARALAAEGARVVAGGRDARAATEIAARAGVELAGAVALDVTDGDAIRAGLDDAERIAGGLDVLVCAVARPGFGSVWDYDRAEWEQDVLTKYVGTADLCREVAARMRTRESGGSIVVLTGIASHLVMSANPAGGAANAALESFVRTLSAEAAPAGIRVLAVSPGMTRTSRLELFAPHQVERIANAIPCRRIAEPSEIAALVAFCASPKASYLTGTTVTVDGGLSSSRRDREWTTAIEGEGSA